MKILHIVAGVWSGSGIAEVVAGLSRTMRAQGNDVVVATLDGAMAVSIEEAQSVGVRMVRFKPSQPHFLYFSWGMLLGLGKEIKDAEVVHVHGSWTFPVWWGAWLALRYQKTSVMSPHGCLDPVRRKHSGWKKQLVGWIDRWLLRRASVIHATCEVEKHWVEEFLKCEMKLETGNLGARSKAVKKQGCNEREGQNNIEHSTSNIQHRTGEAPKIVVIPNGVEVGKVLKAHNVNDHRRTRTVLFLGRLHPLKGLDLLISAWKLVAPDYPAWQLQIVGPDEQGMLVGLRDQVRRLDLEQQINFGDPVYGVQKTSLMGGADLFVLPTRSENFGIVVAEALAYGVPVICTKGAPWQELVKNHCGWWVDIGVVPLAEALKEAMSLTDEERWALGENGRSLVEAKYRWDKAAQAMTAVYSGRV